MIKINKEYWCKDSPSTAELTLATKVRGGLSLQITKLKKVEKTINTKEEI